MAAAPDDTLQPDKASKYLATTMLRMKLETPQEKDLRIARALFKNTPKGAIKYLQERALLKNTPEDVALFLFQNELDKVALGDYLGEGKDFNKSVLEKFVRHYEYHGMDLLQALRDFLRSFRLPGEAQKINRMMKAFASQFCECNPRVFNNTGACYIISYFIIMLNTDLHNPNIKNKMTVEKFISMIKETDDGKELPSDVLKAHYEAIKDEPIQYLESPVQVSGRFVNPDHTGWLVKEGGIRKAWRKRWFILTENFLFYFISRDDKEPKGIIPLENLEVEEVTVKKKNYCFEIRHRTGNLIKAWKENKAGWVDGSHYNYIMQAKTDKEREEWIRKIRASIKTF